MDFEGIRQRQQATDTTKASSVPPPIQEEHPGGPAQYGPFMQGLRIIMLVIYFFGSCIWLVYKAAFAVALLILCISMHVTQWMGAGLYFYDQDWYYSWMALTKQHFGLLIVTMQAWWTPTLIRVSGDASVRGQLLQTPDGRLKCDFPERMVLLSNHQVNSKFISDVHVASNHVDRSTPIGSTSGGQPTQRTCTAISTSSLKNPSNTSPFSAQA
jgi:lysocardiolipin and lysophospholipid acyltransferase